MSKRIAFCLYKYFPYGGLQRDLLRIAQCCYDSGASIRVYAFEWQGDLPDWIELCLVPKKGWTSQGKNRQFTRWINVHRQANPVDLLVGFNKMPGLDVYYAADGCYESRVTELYGDVYRLGGRYKHFSSYERAVFGEASATQVLMISKLQMPIFQKFYGTQPERLHLLPPGVSRDRIAPSNAGEIRREFREQFQLADDEKLLLMVGSGFKTKGVDRAISALAALPEVQRQKTRLFVIGQDNPRALLAQAKKLGVEQQFQIFEGRDDIPCFMQGADLLIHPARHENTGTVLVEALVAGLPVLVTDVCGYAHYVSEAKMGQVLASPFGLDALTAALSSLLTDAETMSDQWRQRGAQFASDVDVYSMPQVAAEKILECVADKQ